MDDEPDILEQAKVFLEREEEELDIDTAPSAEEALELLENNAYDGIVSDYEMPGMDGLEFLEIIREDRNSDIPFIIFTGKGREEVAIEALNLGANRYLQKGGDPKSQYNLLAEAMVDEVEHREVSREMEKLGAGLFSLVEGSDDFIYIVDEDCRFVFVNGEELERHGVERDEIIGSHFSDLHPEEESQEFEEKVEKVLKTGEPERQETTHEGGERYLVRTLSPVENPETGKVNRVSVISKDITERKKKEEKTKRERDRYEELFKSANEFIVTTNERGYVLRANEWVEKVLGYSTEDLKGEPLKNLIHPDDRDRAMQCWRELSGGEEIKYDLKMLSADGETIHVTGGGTPIERDGEIVELQYNAQDITDRIEAEERAKREKERYEELVKGANELIVTTDPEGYLTSINERAEEIMGYSEEEVKGENILDFAHGKDKEEFINIWKSVLEGGFEEMTVRLESKGGETRWVKAGGRAITEDGEVVEIQYNGQDITELKRAEERAKRERKRFEELFKGANEGIFTTDKDGYLKRINERTEEITGYTEEEMKGKSVLWGAHPEERDKWIELWKRILSGEEPTYQLRIVTKGGKTRHIIASGRPIKEDGEIVEIQYNFKDITKRVESEERERFLHSLLRHDLRNKLSVIEGYSDLLQDYDFPEEQAELVEKIVGASEESMELIENVRTMRKIDLEDEIGEVSVNFLIEDVVTENESLANENGISIEKKLPKFESKAQASDLLKEVFTNLVGNSIQHSKGNKIRISGEELEDEIIVRFEDDGKGISEENKEKIFERDTKFGATGGSGIGLHLVKEIAENYGGSVEVKDSELGGARFDVHLKKA